MDTDILHNAPFISALVAVLLAQGLKPFVNLAIERKMDWTLLRSTGGMPSSHTAAVIALSTSIAMTEGIGTVDFALALTFSSITIHDAMGVRRAAGKQAEVINEWSKILNDIHREGQFTPANLKTMLGHSFSQVLGGFVLGVLVGVASTMKIAYPAFGT